MSVLRIREGVLEVTNVEPQLGSHASKQCAAEEE